MKLLFENKTSLLHEYQMHLNAAPKLHCQELSCQADDVSVFGP